MLLLSGPIHISPILHREGYFGLKSVGRIIELHTHVLICTTSRLCFLQAYATVLNILKYYIYAYPEKNALDPCSLKGIRTLKTVIEHWQCVYICGLLHEAVSY
jgi:hypothetical protein